MQIKSLNLGCGRDIKVSDTDTLWVNADIYGGVGVDLIFDFNKFPWPIESDVYDVVLFKDVLEHLDDVILVMEELHRISKKEGRIYISVPYYSSKITFTDPTHRRGFTKHSFDCFTTGNKYSGYNFYTAARYEISDIRFLTYGPRKFIPFKPILREFLNNITDILEFDLIVMK